MAEFETLTLTTDPRGVAFLTLNRPERHNALDAVLIAELSRAAAQLGADPAVRVVVLTGAGKSFCAGGDIGWFRDTLALDRAGRVAQSAELGQMLAALAHLPKPLIGRIQGPAYGGGIGMIAVCDVAIGAAEARFGLTEVWLGLIPANISPHVIARIGTARARATMLSGALFDAAHAERIGLLDRAVPTADLDAAVEAVVSAHLEAAPAAVTATKLLIRDVAAAPAEGHVALTSERLADAWESPEGRAGIDAFLARRTPPWRSGA
ncbi:crotonase/enoyl-CoA hydratase family protein [Pararhodobacter sp. SW119]|uniref:crotonase/enoyl-CoA hydratase family protein n=1 Tax=Pararhodobacter sp. SW119 TaxID=2780075 RepID=UPI001AE0DBED|nr:crotonase/enoyl-CoA hydratase family protein [Pararhodobacter sp. SW119]